MNYFSGLLVALCFVVFILYIAIEAVRVRHGEKRRFEARFWLFAAFVVLVLFFPRWYAARSGCVVWPSGLLLMLMGLALYYGRKTWIIVFVCCFFGLYFKLQMEKRLLAKTFPAYSEYKRCTKVLIPLIG
jgi:uncharacterized membrane protein